MKKTCSKCGVEKELEEYNNKKNGLHGKHAECKKCLTARTAQDKKNRRNLELTKFRQFTNFVNLCKNSRDKISIMSDGEIEIISKLLMHSIHQTEVKLIDDFLKQSEPKH